MASSKNIYTLHTDEQLIEGYRQNGDLTLLAIAYNRYMEMIYAVCYRYLEDREAAKDAVMDIYMELSEKMLRHDVRNFKSWLYTLSRNHCLMKLRADGKRKVVNIDESFMQSDTITHQEQVDNTETQLVVLDECVEKLPADQRHVIDLFYLKQRSYHQIVSITGFDWNKVRSLVQNGRRNLKICIEKKTAAGDAETKNG